MTTMKDKMNEVEAMIARVTEIMDTLTSERANPNPEQVLTIKEVDAYMEEHNMNLYEFSLEVARYEHHNKDTHND